MDNFVEVDGYLVDVDALTRLEHRCDPALCRGSKSCCAVYDIWIDAADKTRLSKYLPYVPAWTGMEGVDSARCLRWIGAGYVLRKDSEGLCALAARSRDGTVLCSLHLAALSLNLPPRLVKPGSCALWPLSLDGAGVVSVQQDAYRFPCNTHGGHGRLKLHPGVASLVRAGLGEGFAVTLEKKLKKN